MHRKITVFIVFTAISLLFLSKLDRHYFFTDEILYAQRGTEHLSGEYSDTLQVPVLPKIAAGFIYKAFFPNVALMRLPYALSGVLCAFMVFVILKRELGFWEGILGALFFSTSKIIFDSTRMVMLDPLMHLFWILFHYFFYIGIVKGNLRHKILAGIFLGLSFATKITSVVLIPFMAVIFVYDLKTYRDLKKVVNSYLITIFISLGVFFVTYLPMFLSLGVYDSLYATLKQIYTVYAAKSDEGKIHVIGDEVYIKSPYWAYLYFLIAENGLLKLMLYMVGLLYAVIKKNYFVFYWSIFTFFTFLFLQFSGVKNTRYVASFEIPLIFLTVYGISKLIKSVESARERRWAVVALVTLVFVSSVSFFMYFVKLDYTKYLYAFNFLKSSTNNFTEYKRMYGFGSVRSMKWYREFVPNEHMFLYRTDYDIMCPEFAMFDYIFFDKESLLKDPENLLHKFVLTNFDSFATMSVPDMEFYIRDFSKPVSFLCP